MRATIVIVSVSVPVMMTRPLVLSMSIDDTPSASTTSVTVLTSWARRSTMLNAPQPKAPIVSTLPAANQAVCVPDVMAVASSFQPPQDREHAAVVLVGGGQAELGEDVADMLLDGLVADDQLAGDRRVRASLGHQRQHFALTR